MGELPQGGETLGDAKKRFFRSLPKATGGMRLLQASALEWSDLGPSVSKLVANRVNLESFRTKALKNARAKFKLRESSAASLSVGGMIDRYGFDSAYKKMGILNEDEISVPELGSYLVKLLRKDKEDSLLRDSDFRKMVIIYDFVKYRYGKSPDLNH